MSKINTKPITFGLKILSILAFSLLIIPAQASADVGGYVTPYNSTGLNNNVAINEPTEANNPKPIINSINPSSSDINEGAKTITITGNGFVPSSVARWNGANRPTTFIDDSHLLVNLSTSDMYGSSGRYITVFNGAPGGGYSNAAFFTINNSATTPNTQNNNVYNSSTNSTNNDVSNSSSTTQIENEKSVSSLASSAILGSNSFLPSGLIQWIILAIIILLIIILVRKVFGARQDYDEVPMKHA